MIFPADEVFADFLPSWNLKKSINDNTVEPGDKVTVSLEISGVLESKTITRQKADIALVMDVSGSMSWEFGCNPQNPLDCDTNPKINAAKTALKSFIDTAEENFDYISLISYNQDAFLRAPLQNMTNTNKDYIKSAIDALIATSSTSIGDGVDLGNKELSNLVEPTSTSRENVNKYIILASDGKQNTCLNVHGPDIDCGKILVFCKCDIGSPDILNFAIVNKIKIFTIGIGWDIQDDNDYYCEICKKNQAI